MHSRGHKGNREQMGSVRVRFHVAKGFPSIVLLPVSFGIMLTGEITISLRSREEKMCWPCLCFYF